MASKPRRKGKGLETPESPDGVTGRGMERQGEEGRLKGLVRYPPGSNGGVHRGPDLGIRRNVMEGLLMRAMIREGAQLRVTPGGQRRVHRSKIPMAMAENFVTRLQLIVLVGTDANVLRLLAIANDVFKPGKNEKNGDGGGPFPAIFQRPPKTPAPQPGEGSASAPSAPGILVNANGQEYVAVV